MSIFNKTALSSAIAVVLATSSFSASADLSSATSRLVNDSSLNIFLRNAYFNKTDKYNSGQREQVGKKRVRQWAQGAAVNFESGYFGSDAFGIGANVSYYGAEKIKADRDSNVSGDLLNRSDSQSMNGYSKFAIAETKINIMETADIEIGRMLLDNPVMASSGSRLLPSSFEAGNIALNTDTSIGSFGAWGLYTNRWSKRNASGFKSFKTGDDQDIDDVTGYGASYSHDSGFSAEAAYGSSDDFMEKLYLNANYVLELEKDRNLTFDLQYYTFEDDGNLWTDASALTTTSKADELDATTYSLTTEYNTKWWTASLTYTTNEDDKAYYYMSSGDHGTIYLYTSMQVSDFLAKEEDVFQANFAYDFGALGYNGLNFKVNYTLGFDGEYVNRDDPQNNGEEYDEWEWDWVISYAIQEGQFEGLTFSYKGASYGNDADAEYSLDTFDVRKQWDHRLFADYTFVIF